MNQKVNLFVCVLVVIEVVCCFIPGCLLQMKYTISSRGILNLTSKTPIAFSSSEGLLSKLLLGLIICSALAVIVIHLWIVLQHNQKVEQIGWIVSVIHAALLCFYLIYLTEILYIHNSWGSIIEGTYGGTQIEYALSWMSFVVIILDVASLVLVLMLRFNKKVHKRKDLSGIQKDPPIESLNDLLAYKELLDSGVITQKEFEMKKEQILKLNN